MQEALGFEQRASGTDGSLMAAVLVPRDLDPYKVKAALNAQPLSFMFKGEGVIVQGNEHRPTEICLPMQQDVPVEEVKTLISSMRTKRFRKVRKNQRNAQSMG